MRRDGTRGAIGVAAERAAYRTAYAARFVLRTATARSTVSGRGAREGLDTCRLETSASKHSGTQHAKHAGTGDSKARTMMHTTRRVEWVIWEAPSPRAAGE